jgi:hypothetical protein
MRAFVYSMLTIILLGTAVPCSAEDFEAQMGFRYRAWSSNADESGYQIHLPVHLRGAFERLSWGVVAGYASTSGELAPTVAEPGGVDASISGILDTQVNLAYLLPNLAGFDWLIGMDVNVPTGRTNRNPQDLKMMIDSDLVWIVSPGQGLNFNPFINLGRRWHAWTFGLGMGYAFQGEYDYSTDHPDYDPGDLFTTALEIRRDWESGWQARLFGQYATFGADTLGGQDLLQRGDVLLAGAGLRLRRETYGLFLTLQAITREKSKYRHGADPGISTESRNSYGNEWMADLGGHYRLGQATTAGATVSYLHVEANDYDRLSDYHIGQRNKAALALDVRHELNKRLRLKAGIEGFIMEDDPNWRHPAEDRTYRGWSLTLSAATRF